MLSDEEKKTIERIEDVFYQDLGKGINKFQKITLYEDSITDIRTILNLIEKQSKEIEDYIENKELINQTLGLEKSANINKTLEKIIILNNYEDKIKAKIEEIEKRQEDLRQMPDSVAKSLGIEDCQEKIILYKELLEKE